MLKIGKTEVAKNDSVVKMLDTYNRARQSRTDSQNNLDKLIDRINLDRPIMQKEKIDLILLEKLKTEKPDQDIKSSHIREALKDVQASRKVVNKRNTATYFKMIHYLSERHEGKNGK